MTRQELIARLHADRPMPPEGFEARLEARLSALMQKEEIVMKRKFSAGLVLALVILLATFTAFAATGGFGLMDILAGHQNRTLLPEANDIVEKNIPQSSVPCQWADFEIRDAAYDGLNLYLSAVIRPLQDNLMLTEGFMSFSTDKIRNLGIENDEDLYNYCLKNGAAALSVAPRLEIEGCHLNMFDSVWEEDGSMTCLLVSEELPPEKLQEELTVSFLLTPMTPLDAPDRENWSFFTFERSERQQGSVTFTVKKNGVRATATHDLSVDFKSAGVRMDRIELVSTAFGTRVTLDYTVVDEEKYALTGDGLWFEFLDESGHVIGSGAIGGGSVGPIDESTLRYRQTDNLSAMQTLPKALTVRAYNCWTKERYGTQVIETGAE